MESKNQTSLYGLRYKETIVVSSLTHKDGLNCIGKFYQEEKYFEKDALNFSLNDGKLCCIYFHKDGKKEPIEVKVINYTTDFNNRNRGLINESALQQNTVTIFGLGSGGSATAIYLVRCGITNLILIDPDTVDIKNICRSTYDLNDIGKKKTNALYEQLIRINPQANIQLYDEDIMNMEDEKLEKIINASDLIMECTDNPTTKRLINGLAYKTTPVLYPAVYAGGKGGDILFTLPGLPCWECVFNSFFDEMKEIKKSDMDYQTGQAKPVPALISDIQIIVARSVKIALAILTGDQKDSLLDKVTEKGCTMLLIGNEKNVSVFDRPFQEVWAETRIDPECSCQTLV
jgi:molybdopterin/thiamine biosynthesis adenylyltransferase